MGHPQPSPKRHPPHGHRSQTKWWWVRPRPGLRYSRAPSETREEGGKSKPSENVKQSFHRSVGEPAEGSLTHRVMQPANRGPLGLETEPLPLSLSLRQKKGLREAGRGSSPLATQPVAGVTPHTHAKNTRLKQPRARRGNPERQEPKQTKGKLSTTDILALATMKNAAKCDT